MSTPNARLRVVLGPETQLAVRSVDNAPTALLISGAGIDIELVLPPHALAAVSVIAKLADRVAALHGIARERASQHGERGAR